MDYPDHSPASASSSTPSLALSTELSDLVYADDVPPSASGNLSGSAALSPLFFPEDCVDMNRLLWVLHRDPTARPLVAAIFAVVYALIILIGVSGNACVLLAISRTRSLQTVSNLFIFALSCSDIVVCCVSATFTPFTAFRKVWVFGATLCSLVPFIAGTSLCFSTFILAAISVDRFLLIRFPLNNQLRHGHAIVIILMICLLAMVLSLPMLYTQKLLRMDGYCGQFCFEHWGPNDVYREIYGTLLLIVQFFVPLAVISICYVSISIRLNRNILRRRKKMGNSWHHHHQRMADRRRQRTNRMFILMVCAFILSWIWSVLFNILRDFGFLPGFIADQEFLYGIITHSVAMTSTIWNPILYALLNLQLRSAFFQLLPKGARKLLLRGRHVTKFGGSSNGAKSMDKSLKHLLIGPTMVGPSGAAPSQQPRSASLFPGPSGAVGGHNPSRASSSSRSASMVPSSKGGNRLSPPPPRNWPKSPKNSILPPNYLTNLRI